MATSEQLMKKKLECPVCLLQYDLYEHLPTSLRCHHTLCRLCVDGLTTGGSIKCPVCRTDSLVSEMGPNYVVKDVMETLCESCQNEQRAEKCHHCHQHLCSTCHDQHAEDYHSEIQNVIGELRTEIKQSMEATVDQTVLNVESEKESETLEEMKSVCAKAHREIDQLEKELEDKIRELKNDNKKKHVEWRNNLDIHITKTKKLVDQCENKLGTKYNKKCTTEEMSEVHTECKRMTEELHRTRKHTPKLVNYKYQDLPVSLAIGHIVTSLPRFTADQYKLAVSTNILGSQGSGPDEFSQPIGVACSGDTVVVCDTSNHLLKVYDSNLNFKRTFGQKGSGFGDFDHPLCVCFGPNNEIFVSDAGNGRIKVYTVDGQCIRTFGKGGSGDGQFSFPMGILVSDGEVIVCDRNNFRIQVTDLKGNFLRYMGSKGSSPGQFKAEPSYLSLTKQFNHIVIGTQGCTVFHVFHKSGKFVKDIPVSVPSGMGRIRISGFAVDDNDNIVMCELGGRLIVVDKDGDFLCTVGSPGTGRGELKSPADVTLTHDGFVVTDYVNNRLQHYKPLGT